LGINLSFKKHFLVFGGRWERSLAVDALVVLYSFLTYIEGILGLSLTIIFKFIYKYGGLNAIPNEYLDQLPKDREAIRIHFAELEVTDTRKSLTSWMGG
jgi:hypothetical protein